MWCKITAIFNDSQALSLTALVSLVATLVAALFVAPLAQAAPGINETINFQGRLLTSTGAVVPDGYYNIEFKIYQDGTGSAAGNPGGTLEWTETYINNNNEEGVQVKNGFLSVNLGSLNDFGTDVDWDQDTLWLSMNVAGSDDACTSFGSAPCTADGEMLPMKRMTSSPYALNSGRLGGLAASNFVQLAQGVQTDASAGVSSVFINKTNTGNLLQLQNTGVDILTIENDGDLQFGANADHTISIGTAGASTDGNNLTVVAGAGGAGTGNAGGDLLLQGGNGGGTNGDAGSIAINTGAATGAGSHGTVSIGTSNPATVQIGNTTLAQTQTINIGNNATASSVTNVTIGSTIGASATTINSGSGNINLVGAVTGSSTINAVSGFSFNGTAGDTTTCGAGEFLEQQVVQGGIVTGGTCSSLSATVTLQDAYDDSGATPHITLGPTGDGILIRDAASTVGGNLFAVQNNDGSSSYLAVTTSGASVAGTFSATGTINGVTLSSTGATFGSAATTIGLTTAGASTAGGALTVQAGTGGSGAGSTGGNLVLQGGNGGGTNGGGGNATVDAGAITGSGTRGSVSIGTTNAGSVAIGSTNSTISIQGNATASAVSIQSAASGTIGIGTANAANTITIGNTANAVAQTVNLGFNNTASSTTNVNIGNLLSTSATLIQGGTGASAVRINSGVAGTIGIGTANTANTVQIGSTTLSSGTQTIGIGNNNTAGGTTNVTIGTGSTAAGGTTTIQSKGDTVFNTNGTGRARFSGSGNTLYVGNGDASGQAATANAFTIQGTSSTGANVQGGSVTLQSGAATSGNANGGNLNLTAGAGVGTGSTGLVLMNTPTYLTAASDANCFTGGVVVASSCTITGASINGSSAVIIGFSTPGQTASMPDPTILTAGRVVYVTAANGSTDFTLSVNGGGTGNQIAMRQNTTATMIWNGSDWTAAGASSSTTLQAAYDNTLTSAGGAELVLSNGSNANGLTIRDSSTNPVNGTLLEVQNSAAATLFSVNANVTEYASNAGAEEYAGLTTFPPNTWLSAPTAATVSRNTTSSNIASGQGSVSVVTSTTAGSGVKNQLDSALTPNQHYNVSFAAKLASGTFTDMEVYYSNQGTNSSVLCTNGQAIKTSVWTKINCTFTASSSGITTSNAIIIRQTGGGTARTFYVDNLSVTIAADFNYATDGTVNDNTNFATNWTTTGTGSTVTRNTTDGQEASDSAQAVVTTGGTNRGVRNLLSISPLPSTLYRVSVYAKQTAGAAFTDFSVRYSRNNGTNFVDCVDYNTQTVSSTWVQITCYITTDGTSATAPYVYFVAGASANRTFLVDDFSFTLASNNTPNVQIGSGVSGGPTTLLTLDKGASAPIAENNDALLGSMYYDTSLGKLQCYEADGWGACGSSPDNIVTLSPEYTNAVMHGTGVGTMTSDICSDDLNINDGSSSQPTICGAGETFNFYKWTSPQPTAQDYSVYVTYQLPGTFKEFASGSTSLMGRTDSTNSRVQYRVYRNDGSGLTACGSAVVVSTGVQSTWQTVTATGSADPSTCGFAAGNSIVFVIEVRSSSTANAYVGNLGFTFSNR